MAKIRWWKRFSLDACWHCPLALVILTSAIAAQGFRWRAQGSVVDRDGKPIVGATVHCASTRPAFDLPIPRDVAEATSRRAGRFTIKLLSDHTYVAWASFEDDAGGTHVTRPVTTQPGQRIQLVASPEFDGDCRLRIQGLEAWRPHSPRLVAKRQDEAMSTVLTPDADGFVKIPRRFGPVGKIELIDSRGGLLHSISQRLGQTAGAQVRLPPPLPIPVLVRTNDVDARPISDAQACIYSRGRDVSRAIRGVTDRGGKVTLIVANRGTARRHEIVVRAPGFALGTGSARLVKDAVPDVTIPMERGYAASGIIKPPRGQSSSGIRVFYDMRARRKTGGRTRSIYWRRSHVATDDSGAFEIPGLGAGRNSIHAIAWLPDALLAKIVGEGQPLPMCNLIAMPPLTTTRVDGDVKMETLDLSRHRPLDVTVREPDGRPAAFAEVRVALARFSTTHGDPVVVTNRRGRCRVLAGPGISVVVRSAAAFACAELNGRTAQTIELEPMKHVRGRVVDAAGKPVPRATIQMYSATFRTTSSSFKTQISNANQRLLRGITDAQGRFALRFVPLPGVSYGLRATVRIGTKGIKSVTELHVGTKSIDDGKLTLEARIDRPKTDK